MRWKLKPQYFIHKQVIIGIQWMMCPSIMGDVFTLAPSILPLAFFITTLLLYYLPNPNQPNPTQPTNHCMRALVMSELVGKMRSWDLKLLCILRTQTRAWDLKFQCIWDLKQGFETCICYVFEISNKILRDLKLLHIWDLKRDLEIWSFFWLKKVGMLGNDQLNMYLGI